MPTIKPRSAEDCIDVINKHRDEIEKGRYNLKINPSWVKSMKSEYLAFLVRFCPEAREGIGSSTDTPEEILEALFKAPDNEYYSIKRALAGNTKTPANILKVLASIEDNIGNFDIQMGASERVRREVAGNPSSPVDILDLLSRDEDEDIRIAVAENPSTPLSILDAISRDENASITVKEAVFSHPTFFKNRAKGPNTEEVKSAAKNNPNFPKSNCFIATAVYGTSDAPEVVTLRNFRDTKLITNPLGRLFVRLYYRFSPPFARAIEKNSIMKGIVRTLFIVPMVKWVRKYDMDKID